MPAPQVLFALSQASVYTELSRKCSKFDTLNSPEYTELLRHISLLPQICNNFVFLDLITGTSKLSFDAIISVGQDRAKQPYIFPNGIILFKKCKIREFGKIFVILLKLGQIYSFFL